MTTLMSLLGLWRFGFVALLLAAASIWHWADKSKAVDDAIEMVRAEYITDALAASEQARTREKQLQTKVEEAKNAAVAREKTLLADAGRSRLATDRLRDDITTIRASLPGLARDAVERYADAASVVFNECVHQYRDVAAQADGLASDRQTLIEAWPRD